MAAPRFRSKVDLWLAVILAAAPVVSLTATVLALRAGGGLMALLPTALIALAYLGAVFPLYYELEDDALVIRAGLLRSRIPYAQIRAVRPTRNPLSSPALSLDRLHVDAGSALGPNISPADREGFLSALLSRAPQLHRVGEALVRR